MDIAATQRAVFDNKVAKGFNTTEVPLEFCLLQGEVAEAFEAWHHGSPTVGEELADVAIYLFGLSQMLDIDLGAEIERKIATNAERTYNRLPSGAHVRSGDDASRARES